MALKWHRDEPGVYRSICASSAGGYLRFRLMKQVEGGWTITIYRGDEEVDSTWRVSKHDAQDWAERKAGG